MPSSLRTLVPNVLGALLLTACAGAPAAGPTASPTPTPAASLAATAAPSVAPSTSAPPGTPSGAPTVSAAPITFHADPTLEAMLPEAVDGQSVAVETVLVADYLSILPPDSDASHQLARFLQELNADPTKVSVAFASHGIGDDHQAFQAYRAPGVRPDRLLAATVYLMRGAGGDPADATVGTTQIGNRAVTTVTSAGDPPSTIHVVVVGDMALASAGSPEQVAALLDALP